MIPSLPGVKTMWAMFKTYPFSLGVGAVVGIASGYELGGLSPAAFGISIILCMGVMIAITKILSFAIRR